MSSEKDIIGTLNDLKKEAFYDRVDNSKVEEIALLLKQIPNHEKPLYLEFVREFLYLCFENGVTVKNISLQDFKGDANIQLSEEIVEEIIEENIQTAKEILEFSDLLSKLINSLSDYFETYKGYFITKLQNDTGNFKLLILYDEHFFYAPLKKKIDYHFKDVIYLNIFDFEKTIHDYNENFLCVFLLMSKMNNNEGINQIETSVKNIISNFQTFDSYCFTTDSSNNIRIENSNEKKKFLKHVKFVISTYLSNMKLHFEEQKIIKKLCQQFETPLVFYKTLKEGFSGANVLEIRPKKSFEFSKENRYIIKYGKLNDDEKLSNEYRNFTKFIVGFKGLRADYSAHYDSTLTHEGIIYNYASSESSLKSFPYSEILDDKKNVHNVDKSQIINELFECELIKHWGGNDFKIKKTEKIMDLYQDYIVPEKIFEKLKIILDLNESELSANKLFINFGKIWSHLLDHNQKVCHGDLHTDNFFKDENSVYLIDFGFTNCRHSLIDYVSLECSIKFKHFPKYIPVDEYRQIESELLSDKTFDLSHTFSSTTRKELLDLLSVINTIRNCANIDLYNPNNYTEYFISLFILTFRQIQYADMNQLYAYHSAFVLSNKIIQDLGL